MLKRNKTRTKNCIGKDVSLKFKSRLKVGSDEADDTECGRAFQARAVSAMGHERSVRERVLFGFDSKLVRKCPFHNSHSIVKL